MSSYSPTARSIRMTGHFDQKLMPRVACSVVMRISDAGSARVIVSLIDVSVGNVRVGAYGVERDRDFLGHHEQEVLFADELDGSLNGQVFVVYDLDVLFGKAALDQAFLDELRNLADLPAAAVVVVADNHVVHRREQTAGF